MSQTTQVLREDVQEVPRLRVVGDIDLAAVRQVRHSAEEHVRDIFGTGPETGSAAGGSSTSLRELLAAVAPSTATFSGRHAAPSGYRVMVLDLSEVPFVDSSGLGGLIALVKEVWRRGGLVVVAGVAEPARQMLELTGLTAMLPHFPDVAGAVRAAQALSTHADEADDPADASLNESADDAKE